MPGVSSSTPKCTANISINDEHRRDGSTSRFSETGPRNGDSHNWLVHRIVRQALGVAARHYARGTLVDIGCGRKPWLPLFEPYVDEYIGVDHVDTQHDVSYADVIADAYETTLPDESADTVVSLAVLEHLEEPGRALIEMARLLKPGGYLLLTAPLFWHVHEAPRDFFRYTNFGLEYLAGEAGLEPVETRPLSGFMVTFAQEFCYAIQPHRRRFWLRPLVTVTTYLVQRFAFALRRWDVDRNFTWMYLLVARKPHPPETSQENTQRMLTS